MKSGILKNAVKPLRIGRSFASQSNWEALKTAVQFPAEKMEFPNQTSHHDPSSSIGKALNAIADQYSVKEAEMAYAFGYGSKVFSQGENVDISNSQIDMMFITREHPLKWHEKNIEKHRGDYSSLASLGAGAVTTVGKWGGGVYFNPFVDVTTPNGVEMELKYGVTSVETLCSDLLNWDTLYLAGRMQKPVAVVVDDPHVGVCQQVNLTNAIRLAIAMQNREKLTKHDLFLSIASLSYLGDPRVKLRGEDPNKVRNIVDNQYDQFDKLYSPVISQYLSQMVQVTDVDGGISVDVSKMPEMVSQLPEQFQRRMDSHLGRNVAEKAKKAVEKTVASAALVQSAKGIITAGVLRSWRYAKAKRLKYQQSQ